eukprot:TRINITY_DN60749_c0_g1_i1.p1 TRINITY_DN60749_c0_g1~~TRINITY_DN60749_c0_g1_i1.p1  ORF type:complete len:208 (+),score=56.35 TRINITY_DN60749_c0_g1_i1:101-724(+)
MMLLFPLVLAFALAWPSSSSEAFPMGLVLLAASCSGERADDGPGASSMLELEAAESAASEATAPAAEKDKAAAPAANENDEESVDPAYRRLQGEDQSVKHLIERLKEEEDKTATAEKEYTRSRKAFVSKKYELFHLMNKIDGEVLPDMVHTIGTYMGQSISKIKEEFPSQKPANETNEAASPSVAPAAAPSGASKAAGTPAAASSPS